MSRPDPWEPGEYRAWRERMDKDRKISELQADIGADFKTMEAKDERIRALEAAAGEAARMMQAIKRTWGPESADDGADGDLWVWLNDYVARFGSAPSGSIP